METFTFKNKTNIGALGAAFLVGMVLSSVFWAGVKTAEADTDVMSQVRSSQSEIYQIVDRIKGELEQVDHALGAIKDITHGSATMLDLMTE